MSKFQDANRQLVAGNVHDAIRLYVAHGAECPSDAAKAYTKAAQAALRSNIISQPVELENGVTLVSQGDLRGAEVFFRRALGANDKYVPALLGLARLVEDRVEKIVLLEKALSFRPDLLAFLELGECYCAAGEMDKAYAAFKRAQEHNPLDRGGYDGLQKVCRALGRDDEAREWAAAWSAAYARKPRLDGHGRSG